MSRWKITCEPCNYMAISRAEGGYRIDLHSTFPSKGYTWEAKAFRRRPWWQFWKPAWNETRTVAGHSADEVLAQMFDWLIKEASC